MKIQILLLAISLIRFDAQAQETPKHLDYADYRDYADDARHADYTDAHIVREQDLSKTDLIDMESMVKSWILETKKIEFSGYPGAFNPSMIKYKDAILMSFRVYNLANGSTNPFALVWLNDQFEPISTPQIFELPFHNPVLPSKQQDPRLITVGERLFVAYNNILDNVTHREIRRMFISELFYDGETFSASAPECLADFEGKSDRRYEKNWVPFEYQG